MTETVQSDQSDKKKGGAVLRFLFPAVIILAGVGAFAAMVMTKEPPEKVVKPYLGPLVESVAAPQHSTQVEVTGFGAVRPAAEIDLVPQVSGIVVWKSPYLETGGFVRAGDLLAQIDPRDYELAVQAAAAELAQAAYRMEIAVGEAHVAKAEWALVSAREGRGLDGGRSGSSPEPLVLHIPQLRAAEANVLSAKARVAEAELRLERTKLHAPFDGRVRQTSLDEAQYVQAGHPVARLYSIHNAEIVVPIPDRDLQWITFMDTGTNTMGGHVHGGGGTEGPPHPGHQPSNATVSAEYGGQRYEWSGQVIRSEAELDSQSRMAHLVVEVAGQSHDAAVEPPVGLFVDVAIRGRTVDGVRRIPRVALRPDDVVWTAGGDGVLRVRPVEVVRKGIDDVLIRVDLEEADERVIVSRLKGATDGMKVRHEEDQGVPQR
jgi:RND family efflux transporter MFP subunit